MRVISGSGCSLGGSGRAAGAAGIRVSRLRLPVVCHGGPGCGSDPDSVGWIYAGPVTGVVTAQLEVSTAGR